VTAVALSGWELVLAGDGLVLGSASLVAAEGPVELIGDPLIVTVPVRMRRATARARSVLADQTPPDKPYWESLAIRMASSTSL
jgi:hypothetical protein